MICSSPTNDKTDWTFSRENEGLKWNLGQFWRSSPVQSKWWKLGWYFAKRKYVDVFLVLFREQRGVLVFFQITDFSYRIRICERILSFITGNQMLIKSKIHNGKSGTIKKLWKFSDVTSSIAPLLKIQILSISQGIFKSHFDGI